MPDKKSRDSLTPGEHLRAELKRLGLDQIAVSEAAGMSRQTINNVVNGRQAISRRVAAKLARLTGQRADYWLAASFPGTRPAKAPRVSSAVLSGSQIIRAVKDGVLVVDPFIAARAGASSLTLTIGTIGGSARPSMLRPGRGIQAWTAERIDLPPDLFARLGSTAQLAEQGLLAVAALQVEPGFSGRLSFFLFNAGSKPCRLVTGAPALLMEVWRMPP